MKNVFLVVFVVTAFLGGGIAQLPADEPVKIKTLIIDGRFYNGEESEPALKEIYEKSGRFTVDVATTPGGRDIFRFKPDFSKYDVIVLKNYLGTRWPKETEDAFEKFVREGGGLVIVHGANNSFHEWKEYNEMIGLGYGQGRNEKDGPYLYVKDGKVVRDTSPGSAGGHGPEMDFVVNTFKPDHPIMDGLPEAFMHSEDELYYGLRGPANHATILATAHSKTNEGGSGKIEPILLVIEYGKGRVFHSMLGHSDAACKCVGFQTTLFRGTEWAATNKVTIPCPDDYPTADKVSVRP